MTDTRSLCDARDPWEPTRRFFAALDELRAKDPNPKLYRLKAPCLFPLPEGRRCCECVTCHDGDSPVAS